MSAEHRFTEEEKAVLIDNDIRSRLIAMVSKKLDVEVLRTSIPDAVHQERIRWSLNWSRLVLGRLFLDFLGLRRELMKRQGVDPRPPRPDDLFVTDIGGTIPNDLSDDELESLSLFISHADKLVHFAWHPSALADEQVDRAVGIIVKALRTHLYDRTKRPFPLAQADLQQLGVG